jgi:hypothetical protein
MLMGAVEEGGKAAVAAVTGLAAQPLALALVCINVAFLSVSIWFLKDIVDTASAANIRRDALMMQLIKDCTTPTPKRKDE